MSIPSYAKRIQNKIKEYSCRFISAIQKDILCDGRYGYITIFHDHEGEYASIGTKSISYYSVLKILEIEKKYAIKTTYNVVGKLLLDEPDVARKILDDGHELASHSYQHDIVSNMKYNDFFLDIQKTKEIFQYFGVELIGFRSPQSKWSISNLRVLLNQGIKWNAESDCGHYPFILLRKGNKMLVRMPVVMDDWAYKLKGLNSIEMKEKLFRTVDKISSEKTYGAIGFHPWVQGEVEERMELFENFISYISKKDDLKILTFKEVYQRVSDKLFTKSLRMTK